MILDHITLYCIVHYCAKLLYYIIAICIIYRQGNERLFAMRNFQCVLRERFAKQQVLPDGSISDGSHGEMDSIVAKWLPDRRWQRLWLLLLLLLLLFIF